LPDGTVNPPLVQAIGTSYAGGIFDNRGVGQCKISAAGNRIACAITSSNAVDLFDFNVSTGTITNLITTLTTIDEPYGLEFSPDANRLYITSWANTTISVYDIQNQQLTSMTSNPDLVKGTRQVGGKMQLGPDGLIYAQVASPYISDDRSTAIINPANPVAAPFSYPSTIVYFPL